MNGKMDRRDFLNGMLPAAASLAMASFGAVHPAQSLPGRDKTDEFRLCHEIGEGRRFSLPEPEAHRYDCVIVGGGISGLTAAWKLQRLGIKDILLLERNETAGGLCRSDTFGTVTAARASAYLSFPFNDDMTELYRDLDLVKAGRSDKARPNRQYRLQPPYDQVFINGKWVRDPFDEGIANLPVSQSMQRELRALGAALAKLEKTEDARGHSAFDCPLENSSEDPKLRGLDAITLGEYVAAQGWSREMIAVFDPLLRSAYGLGHDRISAWAALDLLSDEISGKGSLCFPGGNAFLADSLMRRVGSGTLLTNAFVVQVRERNGEVNIAFVEGGRIRTVRARAVICALPQLLVPYLLRDLPAERQKVAKSLEYTPYLVANVAVSKTPANLAYSNQLVGDFILSDFIVADWAGLQQPLAAPLDRPNVLTAYCPLPLTDRGQLLSQSFDHWQAKILAELERCLPGVNRTVTAFYLYRWGHAFAAPAKGWLFSEARQLIRQPLGRIFFAGADVEGIPTVDHAMGGGFRTAREVTHVL